MVSVFFKTFKCARWIINFGYFLGVFPFYWDSTRDKLILVKSSFAWARFYVTTVIYFFITLLIAFGFLATVVFDVLDLSKINKVITSIKFLAAFALALLHAHTYWKLHEITSFANCSSEFGESFLGKHLHIIKNKKIHSYWTAKSRYIHLKRCIGIVNYLFRAVWNSVY